jgi:transmembrane sensor
MNIDQMREMVDRYLTGSATHREKESVEKWLQARPGDDRSLEAQHQQTVKSALWQSISQTTNATAPQVKLHPMRNYRLWPGYAAAILLVVLGSMWFLATRHKNQPAFVQTFTAPPGSYKTIMLPDSSVAHLFPGTTLTIAKDFNVKERNVTITGRIFFEVKHNPARPFYVHSGELLTRVLGTSFEVMAPDSNLASVIVRTGKVGVLYGGQHLSDLTSGKRLQYSLQQRKFMIDEVDAALVCEWWNHGMVFNQAPLAEVLQQLSNWYNIPVEIINPRWKKETATIRIKDQSFTEALTQLSESLGFQYRKENKRTIIF